MKREHKIYRWGEELTAFAPRIPGTGNMDLARDYICEKLKSFGIEPELEAINFRGVFHQSWSLDIIAPFQKAITCYPENNVGFGDLAAELVDVGFGNAEDYKGRDVKGKIVLVNRGDLTRHELDCGLGKRYPLLGLYDNAWENGAAGMIGYFTDTPGNALKVLEPGIKITGGSNITGPAEAGDNNGFLLSEKLQKIPGRLLRRLEIPGKSLFGCGTLFSDTTMPDYPKGEVYSPEEPPPLYYGGADGIVSITYK